MESVGSDNFQKYEGLEEAQKGPCLLRAAFNFTIETRGLYELPLEMRMPMYRAANELQHRLLAQTMNQLTGKKKYPPNVFFAMLDEIAAKGNLSDYWNAAFHTALAVF